MPGMVPLPTLLYDPGEKGDSRRFSTNWTDTFAPAPVLVSEICLPSVLPSPHPHLAFQKHHYPDQT